MPRKPTFTPVNSKGVPYGNPVAYTPILFMVGSLVHKLALHRDPHGITPMKHRPWVVSHPQIGAKICIVYGSYKGAPIQSSCLTEKEAFPAAVQTLNDLCEKIGSDKFNAVIQKGFEMVRDTENV